METIQRDQIQWYMCVHFRYVVRVPTIIVTAFSFVTKRCRGQPAFPLLCIIDRPDKKNSRSHVPRRMENFPIDRDFPTPTKASTRPLLTSDRHFPFDPAAVNINVSFIRSSRTSSPESFDLHPLSCSLCYKRMTTECSVHLIFVLIITLASLSREGNQQTQITVAPKIGNVNYMIVRRCNANAD
ncbi:unnamed protein product [Xylocopa violacea]|uniref:Uncharacterized protein n=1 Tax=Xylocopa violacea TaxID=135666 RepID=A0ABP1P152_XYLVO